MVAVGELVQTDASLPRFAFSAALTIIALSPIALIIYAQAIEGRLGDIEDAITQKLMILLSIQVLLIAFTAIVCIGYLIKRFQFRRSIRNLDLDSHIEKRLGKIPPMNPKRAKLWYERTMKRHGEEAPCTIKVGVNLANVLLDADRWLEGERLLVRMAATIRRVHGDDYLWNPTAVYVQSALKCYRTRVVRLKSRGTELFELLPYDVGDATCTVVGPTGDDLLDRVAAEEETFAVDASDLLLQIGTPVVCHGLSARSKLQHLNGKIGCVMSWDSWTNPDNSSGMSYDVRFEGKHLKQCLVDSNNVQVVFDLPDSEKENRRKKTTRL